MTPRHAVAAVAWTTALAVVVVVGVTLLIEWRRPDPAVSVRAAVRDELAARDAAREAFADSVIARTDSIMVLLERADSSSAAVQRELWLDVFRGLHDEHARILANQAASRSREMALRSDLVNAICWWTGNRAAVCR